MTRLCQLCAVLSVVLTTACATGEAPEAVDSNRMTDRVADPAVVIQLEQETWFDRFDEVWVEVGVVELYDPLGRWKQVDTPPALIEILERRNGFGTNRADLDRYSKVRLTITSAFAIAAGVSEDLAFEPLTIEAEVGGIASVDLRPGAYRTSRPER